MKPQAKLPVLVQSPMSHMITRTLYVNNSHPPDLQHVCRPIQILEEGRPELRRFRFFFAIADEASTRGPVDNRLRMTRPVAAGLLVLGAMVLAAATVGTQQTGASRTALALVSDARNRSIVDVGADDFVIQEAGQSREVLSVRVADYPIVVMLDNGTDGRGDFAMLRKAVERLLARLGPRPVAIGTLADPPRMLTTLDDDRQTALDRLDALEVSATARSAMLRGAALGGETIRASGALFSALVVLSATPLDASRGSAQENIAPILDSHAVLHVIANRATQLSTASGQVRGGQVLRSIAEQTRGAYTVIYSPASYQAALDHLADRLTSEMMVEYLVPPDSKPIDVKVGVRLPGARVRGLGVAPR